MRKSLEDPTVKGILLLLGVGTVLVGTILMPTLPMALKPIIDFYKKRQRENDLKQWNRFNQARLKFVLKRLHQQKVVEISEEDGVSIIKLSDKGRVKFLKYKMEEIMVDKPPRWDGKWRLIIYDIRKEKRILSEIFRSFLKKMEFLKLQRSVYLTPYKCGEQIEFLRQYYGLDKEVLYLVVEKIENEKAYKDYFGI